MRFGVYIHIPYCLQKCTYCDFATVPWNQSLPPGDYVQLLRQEIQTRAAWVGPRKVNTVYLGGGTPSLLEAEDIIPVLQELEKAGFDLSGLDEFTIEINPGTITPTKLDAYLDLGINRFSVGAQTFNDAFLKKVHREHTAATTRETLSLLNQASVNYSFDLLFGLPGQGLKELDADLEELRSFRPDHVSAYCLTIPENHPLNIGRAPDPVQVEMFLRIESALAEHGIFRYEISNYARPGGESQHNQIYWTDQEYWGLGLSAHSYLHKGPWGLRFWNAHSMAAYQKQAVLNGPMEDTLPKQQVEPLALHQALTDYCHTSLRMKSGLIWENFQRKFGAPITHQIRPILQDLERRGSLIPTENGWTLSVDGRMVFNKVLESLTFLQNEIRLD